MVRSGPGAPAEPEDIPAYIDAFPEIEGTLDPDDRDILESAFDFMMHCWDAAGVVDGVDGADRRLTALGAWVLPRALAWAWGEDFDDDNPL